MIPPQKYKVTYLGAEGDRFRLRILGKEYLLKRSDVWKSGESSFYQPGQVGEEVELMIDGWTVLEHKGFGL